MVRALLLLSVLPALRLSAQDPLTRLAPRLAAMTAVSGLEQAMTDTLLTLVPASTRDRAGNVIAVLGKGSPRRLLSCPVDEPGFVVGNVTDDGYLLLRRVGRVQNFLFDQSLEGHRVTLFGARGPVPGVVAVRSTHLTRGRPNPDQPPFTVDNAFVDVGASSAAEVQALGLAVLTPVALWKDPMLYGGSLLAAPDAGRRTACAALVAAATSRSKPKGTVVIAFTVEGLEGGNPGLAAAKALHGPFDDTREVTLPARFANTPVETVNLDDARALEKQLEEWIGGGK
ncbi:MAG TPA: hypothetical protein VFK78_08500 [Gemmatimonadales bacterium]|nr:hypothetical protein [Gemmatimonadales bacterium]